jgi:hypothetical protein
MVVHLLGLQSHPRHERKRGFEISEFEGFPDRLAIILHRPAR